MAKVKRKNFDLLHVVWGECDQGVVSLKQKQFLFYTWGDRFGGHHSLLPTVYIEDKDFARTLERVFRQVECVGAKAYPKAKRFTHTLFVADRV